jgi:signal transduction histidine kinase
MIAIADNEFGIPEPVQQRIFEQLFTTKPIGKGTELGTSISYQIIQDTHKGKLDCHSSSSQGTKSVIQLLIRQAVS